MARASKLLLTLLFLLLLSWLVLSCGGGKMNSSGAPGGFASAAAQDLCNCEQTQSDADDYRHAAKHVQMSSESGEPITVATMLGWDPGPEPASDAPRSGRELQMFHISSAFLQFAWVNPGDCDLHLEISDTADKNAPRVIVETPHEDFYCASRRQLGSALAAKGFTLSSNSGELGTPLAVDVRGLAFRDFNHSRGSAHVATVWELHPAMMTLR